MMGLFSMFTKKPPNDILFEICHAYHNELKRTKDSSKAFIVMAEESVRQHNTQNKRQLENAASTFHYVGGSGFDKLTTSHDENRISLHGYLYNLMYKIRGDYYSGDNVSLDKNARLDVMISAHLN